MVCLQNGVENERIALRLLPNVYGAVVMTPTAHLEPGIVQAYGTHADRGDRRRALSVRRGLGERRGRARAFAMPSSARMPRPDIMRFKYAKLINNLLNAVDAICEPGPASDELIGVARGGGPGRP